MVLAVNVAEVVLAATLTEDGTVNRDEVLLESVTTVLLAVGLSAGATIYAKGTLSAKGSTLHAAMSSAWQFLLAAVWLGA